MGMEISFAIQKVEERFDYEGNEISTEAWNTIRTFVAETVTKHNKQCPLCPTWMGSKRYTYCPDCGHKLR